jgi:hypothetical protein
VLGARGYTPEKTKETSRRRAAQEQELQAMLDADARPWRRGRIRDVVAAREMVIELGGMLDEQLSTRGLSYADAVRGDRQVARDLARCMPGVKVAVEIKTQYHRDPGRQWAVNDIHDIDAMALAVPYCDIVFTDAAVRRALLTGRIGERMGTALPRRPDELADALDGLEPTDG